MTPERTLTRGAVGALLGGKPAFVGHLIDAVLEALGAGTVSGGRV